MAHQRTIQERLAALGYEHAADLDAQLHQAVDDFGRVSAATDELLERWPMEPEALHAFVAGRLVPALQISPGHSRATEKEVIDDAASTSGPPEQGRDSEQPVTDDAAGPELTGEVAPATPSSFHDWIERVAALGNPLAARLVLLLVANDDRADRETRAVALAGALEVEPEEVVAASEALEAAGLAEVEWIQ